MGRLSSRLQGGRLITAIVLVDALSSCWFGYCQGVFAGVLVSEDFQYWFPETYDANISGITVSCFLLGAFFGSMGAFVLGDKLGRKKTIVLGLGLNFIGALLQTIAWHLPQMIIGRLINGFGLGFTSTMTPVYLSECAKSHMRGKLVVIGAASNVSTFALANWISYALYFTPGPVQWRFPLGFQLIFPFIIVPLLFFVPESPRWLLLMDKEEEALGVLARLAGNDIDPMDPIVVSENRSIKVAIRREREERVPVVDMLLFRDKAHNMRRLLLGCGTQLMQQFSGINALGFYLPTLLHEDVGYSLEKSRMLAAISGTIYLVFAFASILVIDRLGRRKMMLCGTVTMGACHLVASMCLRAGEKDASKKVVMGTVTTAMFIIYHFFFGISFSGVPWVYSAEISSLGWRTRGAAAATGTNWLGGFVVTQFTKVGIEHLRWAFYLIFAIMCFLFWPVIFCFYPETANRTLEDMHCMFMGSSVFVFGKREMTQQSRPEEFVLAEMERIAGEEENKSPNGFLTPPEL